MVCGLCNLKLQQFSFLDINIFLFKGLLNSDILFPSKMLRGCLVCVICNSSSFHFFIFKFSIMIVHTLNMCTLYFVQFDKIFWSFELGHYYVHTTFGVLTLSNLCVNCISNRFHSFIFELCIMIVHTLKMCTDNTGPEQSLVCWLKGT